MTLENTVKGLLDATSLFGFVNESCPSQESGCFVKEANGKIFHIEATNDRKVVKLVLVDGFSNREILKATAKDGAEAAQFVRNCLDKMK